MQVSTITTKNKQVMMVYAAKNYTKKHPCTGSVEFNAPEYLPSTPTDNSKEYVGINRNMFANVNFPSTARYVQLSHSIELNIMRGTSYPSIFDKGTPFLLFTPTGEIEDGYLMYV